MYKVTSSIQCLDKYYEPFHNIILHTYLSHYQYITQHENILDYLPTYLHFQYGKTWLETKVKEQYENAAGISSADILQSIITLLNSPRTNDEMQNDLFELLGFDKFEFILDILEHRQDIINSLKAPPAGPTLSESK